MIQTDSALRNIKIRFPGQIIIGKNSINELAGEITGAGHVNVLIITIDVLLPSIHPVIERLRQQNVHVRINTSVTREPFYRDVESLLKFVAGQAVDAVIGIGGGSVLDMAKIVAAQIKNDQTISEITGNGLLRKRGVKLICVPTTAGTGSEVSPNAILIDDTDNQKKGIISPYLVPDTVIIDPALTYKPAARSYGRYRS
jgi:alcohol dehydrogenase class IV